MGGWTVTLSTRARLDAPTAMDHDEHDDSMNTKKTLGILREHRLIVGIVVSVVKRQHS